MKELRGKAEEFLKKYNMYYGDIDIGESCEAFLRDMNRGLKGEESSLQMIPTYLGIDKEIPTNEPITVIDAGGTNLRVAMVYFDKAKKPIIENFMKYPMPGSVFEISKEEFFNTIARYIGEFIQQSSRIGFCFSYPTEILPNKDGRLIRFCKEVKVRGVEGELIGEGLQKALKIAGWKDNKKIVLLNDTVATLLAGKASFSDRDFSSYIGFILGTGTNCSYIEKVSNIGKLNEIDKIGSMVINIESGAYARFASGDIDVEFDKSLADPGKYVFEKMIAGGYLGGLTLAVIKKAANDGLFSKGFNEKIQNVDSFETKGINNFMLYGINGSNIISKSLDLAEPNDSRLLYFIMDAIIERASVLTAINLSSAIIKSQSGQDPCRPVCITAEGTTFYLLIGFYTKLNYYLKKFLNDDRDIYYEFKRIENATLIGTAIAGLLN